MRVLAVDPGLMTGLAFWARYDDGTEGMNAYELPWFEAMDEITTIIWDANSRGKPLTGVVSERFDISGNTYKKGKKDLYEPLHGIGVVKWACYRANVPFTLQAPGDAMKLVSNDVLKTLGWYTRGKEHGRDATRHLVKYLVDQRLIDARRLIG